MDLNRDFNYENGGAGLKPPPLMNQVKLVPKKTEVLIKTKRRKRERLCFRINNIDIWPKNNIKYLCILFDTWNSFREHLKKVTQKVEDKMARIIKLLHEAPVCEQASSVRRNSMLLQKVQRKILLRLAAAYKTAPTTALQVVTGIPLIDLLAQKRRFIYERKGEETARNAKTRTLHLWQERWKENMPIEQ